MKVLLVFAIALAAVFVAFSQTNGSRAKKSPLDDTWELVSGQPLPKGTRDIKMISGGHFIFVAYDTEKGKPLYTGGGTYILNGSSTPNTWTSRAIKFPPVSSVRTSRYRKDGRRYVHANRHAFEWKRSVGNLEAD